MFLLLLIAVLVGCQRFSGHCPIGNAVLCPLWGKHQEQKSWGQDLTQSLFQRRRPTIARNQYDGGVLWNDKSFWGFCHVVFRRKVESVEYLDRKWLAIMSLIYSFIFGHKCLCSGKTIRPSDIGKYKTYPPQGV